MELALKNVMEMLVLQKLDQVMDTVGCCKCDKCRMDVASYALNHLPPRYVSTHEGELFIKVDSLALQHTADVAAAITAGAQRVREHPMH